MFTLKIPETELFDERTNELITIKPQVIQLEHSLLSLSKWESKYHKPFLNNKEKSRAETLDYIQCMTITQNVDPSVYKYAITDKLVRDIRTYIDDPMTATTISGKSGTPTREIITSEIIYYWMIKLNIPFECQKWHLNRLLMLIRVCEIKDAPSKKMSKKDLLDQNRALNNARRAAHHTSG